MFLEEDKEFIEDNIGENENDTISFMGKLNKALFNMLKNPTDAQVKKFRDTRDAILVGWFLALMGDAEKDYYKAAQIGIDVADRQLKEKGITAVKNKSITKETYTSKVNNSLNSLQQDLTAITESIKANSERIIKELKSSPTANTLQEQKKNKFGTCCRFARKRNNFFYG